MTGVVARLAIALVAGALVIACSANQPSASVPATTPPPPSAVAPTSAAPATRAPTPAPEPSRSRAPEPSVPILDPALCPTTSDPPDHVTDDGIGIDGDPDFIAHMERALLRIETEAPGSYDEVLAGVTVLRQVEAFSGMCYDTGTYRVGEETAHAPGYPLERQVGWLAGTIVHDACHRTRYVDGLEPGGRDGELDCMERQLVALQAMNEVSFADYVRGLIETVDDPASQYWNDPDRHW